MSSTRFSALLDGILEAGWLAAIVVTPLFFDIYSNRVFEPDKLTTLRSIALVMAAAWLLRWVEERFAARHTKRLATPVGWRTPLALPTLLTVTAYLISNALSLTPYVSFFGSYQRLQGTFTTLSYIIVFAVILDRMRTRAQVDRLITTLILNSLPIALYGFVQHARRDPLPWGGDVTQRVASNMGNPIFVAAYLIMAAPPTLARVVEAFRSIISDDQTGAADVLRASTYIFILLVQAISIWYTQSRGPLMGLLTGLAVWALVGLLLLQSAARRRQQGELRPADLRGDLARGFGFGAASLVAAGAVGAIVYLAARSILGPRPYHQWVAAVAAVLVLSGIWLTVIVNGRGWRWLWLGAVVLAVLFGAGFLVVNLVEPVHAWSQQQAWLGRLDDVLQAEAGTGKVRSLIWEGSLRLILPHEPVAFPPTAADPTGHTDPVNLLRPLIGYGPESMYVAYNRFYPPLLGHYESRTASPDRSHNETLDTLVMTGLPGFSAYLWMFGSLFYFGLQWLGLLPSGWRRSLFFSLLAGGGIVAVAAVTPTVGPHFFGLAIPMGMTGGLVIYLVVHGLSQYRTSEPAPAAHPHGIILAGILAAFVAHFIEINFGIAIASTRTTFWALAGVFVLLGLQRIVERAERGQAVEPAPARPAPSSSARPRRRKKRRQQATPRVARQAPPSRLPAWLWTSLGSALTGALLLGTLAYDFVNNVERLTSPVQVFWRSLTVIAIPGPPRVSLGVLLLFGMAWGSTALLAVTQIVSQGAFRNRIGDRWAAALVILTVSLAVGSVFGLVLAGRHARLLAMPVQSAADALGVAEYLAGQISAYYVFLVLILLLGGLALAGEQGLPHRWITPASGLVLVAGCLSWSVALIGQATGTWTPRSTVGIGAAVAVGCGLLGLLSARLIPSLQQYFRPLAGKGAWVGTLAAGLVIFLTPPLALRLNLNPIQADIIYKQGMSWEPQGQWAIAAQHYERAIEKARNEDFYYLYLGRALLEYASLVEDPAQQDWVLRQTEQVLLEAQAINPLNTDHSANLARMYRRWSELPAGAENRPTLASLSSQYYEIATSLSPNNAILWNEWATLYLYSLGDEQGYERCITRSLQVDPEFEQTWLIVGDVRVGKGDLEGAAEAYRTALGIQPAQPQVWSALGRVYLQLGRNQEAIEALSAILQQAPGWEGVWDVHRLLAIAYYQSGLIEAALSEAQLALQMAPEDQRPVVEQMIQQLQPTASPTETWP